LLTRQKISVVIGITKLNHAIELRVNASSSEDIAEPHFEDVAVTITRRDAGDHFPRGLVLAAIGAGAPIFPCDKLGIFTIGFACGTVDGAFTSAGAFCTGLGLDGVAHGALSKSLLIFHSSHQKRPHRGGWMWARPK
jgi:hypothetical protein